MLDTIINYHDKVPINVKVSHIHEQPVHTHNNDLEIIVLLRGTVKVIVGLRQSYSKKANLLSLMIWISMVSMN